MTPEEKKAYDKKYYEANKEKLAATAKIERDLPENKAKLKEYHDAYYALPENKAKLAAKRNLAETKAATNEYQKKRYAENPGYAYYAKFLSAIWKFRKRGGKNGAKHFKKAGFTGEEFNEKFLPPGKSWDDEDMKDQQVDHIIPASYFGYPLPGDANYLACYGLDNLQLLSAAENMAKGAKLDQPKK